MTVILTGKRKKSTVSLKLPLRTKSDKGVGANAKGKKGNFTERRLPKNRDGNPAIPISEKEGKARGKGLLSSKRESLISRSFLSHSPEK